MERILVVKLGALGDLLLAEGALRDIRAHHPGARIDLLTRRPFARWLTRCPWVDEVLVDENHPRWRLDAMWMLAQRLRAPGYTRAYDLQNSARSAFYLRRLIGGGLSWSGIGPGCPLPHPHPSPKSLSVLERHAQQLLAAGVEARHSTDPGADWMIDPADELLGAHGLRHYVVLLPGSSARGSHKRWPHYAELAKALQARELTPVTVPGPDELHAFDGLPGTVLRTASGGALDLHALAGVLRGAVGVVGNDSGPTHLAASLGCPGVAVFGTSRAQARRTCLERGRMRVLAAESFRGLDAAQVERQLLEALAD